MNPRMWEAAATAENLRLLAARGVELVGPARGDTAEGEVGVGRMAEPAEILEAIGARLRSARSLAGVRVLVTAGGTREPLDAVRFLGNRSSGRMGAALAAEARRRGAHVTLVAANLSVRMPVGVDVVQAPTAEDMTRETLARGDADVVLMAAAVADYRPVEPDEEKRPKDGKPWTVTLEPTTDVLLELGGARDPGTRSVLVGFAADRGERGLERAPQVGCRGGLYQALEEEPTGHEGRLGREANVGEGHEPARISHPGAREALADLPPLLQSPR
jgi:phosphopantothenoylcysteine decarboxylase/phosphopantothenate--cysteine ligase